MLVPVAVCPCPNTQALHPCSDIITSPTSEVRRAVHSGGCSSHVSAWLPEPCVSCLCTSCVVCVWLYSCQCVHGPGRKIGWFVTKSTAGGDISMNTLLKVGESLYTSPINPTWWGASVSLQEQELRYGEVVMSTASDPWWLSQDSTQVAPTPGSFHPCPVDPDT